MKTLKKFNDYLLTHQPLLWHSRVIQMTAIMLLLNLVFYAVGYNSVNLDKMLDVWKMQDWFFRESAILYWLLCGLTVLIVWGALFYRNNAAKNFYPISRWYFHKLALCLFLPAMLFLMVPFTYFKGVSNHARQIITFEELQELNTTVQLARPFLISQHDDFGYHRRYFPKKFREVTYWEKQSTDHYMPTYSYQGKDTKIFDILKKEEAILLDSVHRIFAFKIDEVELLTIQEEDTCSYVDWVFQYAYSPDSLPDFKWQHVKNYVPSDVLRRKLFRPRILENFLPSQREILDDEELLSIIHTWIDEDREQILETLQEFKIQLDKYKIKNNIDPEKNYHYLLVNDFHVHESVTIPSMFYYDEEFGDFDVFAESSLNDVDSLENSTSNRAIDHFLQFYEDDQVSTFIENASTAHFSNTFYDLGLLKILGYIAIAVIMLLLYFQWGSVLTFVISIPVAGVLTFVGALFYSIISKVWMQEYFPVHLLIHISLAGLVLFIAFNGVKKVWNSYVTNVALAISYFAWPFWIVLLTEFFHSVLTKNVYNPCEYWPDRIEPFSLNAEPLASMLYLSPYFLLTIWLFFIKRIVAKKDG